MDKKTIFFIQLFFTLLVCSFLVIPVFLSVLAGVTQNFFVGIKSGFTIRWIVEVLNLYTDTIYLSLLIAITCLLLTLIIGIPAAYVLARVGGRISRIIEETIVLPIAVPGLAIALALIIIYGGFRDFRTSWYFILVGHVLYTLPFMVRSVLAVLSSFNFICTDFLKKSLNKKFDLVFSHALIDHVYDVDLFVEKIIESSNRSAYITAYRGYFPDLEKHVMRRNNLEGTYYNDVSIKQLSKKFADMGLQDQEYSFSSIKVDNVGQDDDWQTIIKIEKNQEMTSNKL